MLQVIKAITQHVINVTVDKTKFKLYIIYYLIRFHFQRTRYGFRLDYGDVGLP